MRCNTSCKSSVVLMARLIRCKEPEAASMSERRDEARGAITLIVKLERSGNSMVKGRRQQGDPLPLLSLQAPSWLESYCCGGVLNFWATSFLATIFFV